MIKKNGNVYYHQSDMDLYQQVKEYGILVKRHVVATRCEGRAVAGSTQACSR